MPIRIRRLCDGGLTTLKECVVCGCLCLLAYIRASSSGASTARPPSCARAALSPARRCPACPYHAFTIPNSSVLCCQVILVRDVPGLGSEGSLKTVPVGYWRNYLQPQGLAAFADAGILERIRQQREAEDRARLEEKAKAQAMVSAGGAWCVSM